MVRSSRLFLLVALAVVLLAPRASAYPWQVCGTTGNFTANSTYQANLDLLTAALPKNTSSSPDLFATAVVGAVPEQVSALTLCRGDANATACTGCLVTAFQDVQNMCSYDKDAAIYYDPCILYYSNVHFLSSVDNVASTSRVNLQNVTSDPGRFNRQVAALVNATSDYAAYNSTRRYASGEADLGGEFPKVYSWAQCTPDLTPAQCRGCLADIIAKMPRLFTNRIGGRVLGVRCSYRYEVNPFLNGPVMVRLAAPASSGAPAPAVGPTVLTPAAAAGGGEKSSKAGTIVAIVLPVFAAILAATVTGFCFWRRRLAKTPPLAPLPSASHSESIESIDSLILDLSTLRIATENFAENNKLGEGGFGVGYNVFGSLPDGQDIAVKRLSQSSGQGIGELKNELVLVAKLQHKNLVRLVGVCLDEHEKMLVYEYMPNRSLDTHLFDPDKSSFLDWGRRLKIINGIARGLQYLHEDSQLKIVHRDLKASNVLLDSGYNPKISDFCLARLFGGDQSQDVTNRVVGTYGYMAPEYAMRGHYSIKSDVFSFGVLILEIVTGRRNSGSYNSEQSVDLLSIIWEHWTMGTIAEMVDRSLSERAPGGQIVKCVHVGLLCVQENRAHRPAMSAVNVMLSSNTVSLQAPTRPAFYIQKSASTGRSVPMSPNEMSITELEPR